MERYSLESLNNKLNSFNICMYGTLNCVCPPFSVCEISKLLKERYPLLFVNIYVGSTI